MPWADALHQLVCVRLQCACCFSIVYRKGWPEAEGKAFTCQSSALRKNYLQFIGFCAYDNGRGIMSTAEACFVLVKQEEYPCVMCSYCAASATDL